MTNKERSGLLKFGNSIRHEKFIKLLIVEKIKGLRRRRRPIMAFSEKIKVKTKKAIG